MTAYAWRHEWFVRRTALAFVLAVVASGCTGATPPAPVSEDSTVTEAPDRAAEVEDWEEAHDGVRTCLQDKGFSVPIGSDGVWELNVPPGEGGVDRARTALRECRESKQMPQTAPLTDAEMRAMYRLLVKSHQCLEGQGFALEDPPSEETFVATYEFAQAGQGGVAPWSPYVEIQFTPTIESACPQPELVDLAEEMD